VWVWDYLSLALCLDWAPCELPELETEAGGVRISVSSVPGARFTSLDPWPLRERAVTVRCDGRRLRDGATSDRELRHALACAPLETVEFELRAPAPADHGRGSADQSAVAQTDLRHAS
jgi:hypothetical protein